MSKKKINPVIINKLTLSNIEDEYDNIIKQDDPEKLNSFKLRKELLESENLPNTPYLYPSLNDPNFNVKLAEKKEFYDTQYDGKLFKSPEDIEDQSEKLCNSEFELSPHQLFVRNFLSFQTPYNSLLLYHGLGSGKTCSAISVAEEMRDYLRQIGISQRIIVVASPNVQENFKLQLFDERKLKLQDGLWNIRSCTGNKYLKEINPMNLKGLTKEKVILQIKRIIKASYLFLGYIEFAHYIEKKSNVQEELEEKTKKKVIKKKLKREFNNRLIIIDEIHNIRVSDDNLDNKLVAQNLLKLVSNVKNLRLLLLSATPMFNSFKEIIWLLNLMNTNDNRGTIDIKKVFTTDGNFVVDLKGNNVGEEILKRKSIGYVSYVRGENPYTFPYRIWPSMFDKEHSVKSIDYPVIQLNKKKINQPIERIDLYINKIGSFQGKVYNKLIEDLRNSEDLRRQSKDLPNFENIETFGYTLLQKPLQALNIVYPYEGDFKDTKMLIGKTGLERVMNFQEKKNPPSRSNYSYKFSKFGRIFSPDEIENYSSKIKSITENVFKSEGIILIYSYYIDSGLIPIALALEELGFTRYGDKVPSLFKDPPTQEIDAITYEPVSEFTGSTFFSAKYAMITGDKSISPNNVQELKAITDEENKDGSKVKIVLISKSGAEGLDFKNIRQIHILEPWYNLNLIEQIIGRGVRNCSHKQLPFQERNVEIFLYGTQLEDKQQEAVDLYVYRIAEIKAIQMGRVTRVLKETAVDCILNNSQNNYIESKMNTSVKQKLSNKKIIEFPLGDKPYSSACDYMSTCEFTCKPTKKINESSLQTDTYNQAFITYNRDKILLRIYDLFKEKYFYTKNDLLSAINLIKVYPLTQIYSALSFLIDNENEFIFDEYGRIGKLKNIGDLYLFQPVELNNDNSSVFERSTPIDFKRNKILLDLNQLNYENINQEMKKTKLKNIPKKIIPKIKARPKKIIPKIIEKQDQTKKPDQTKESLKESENPDHDRCDVLDMDQFVEKIDNELENLSDKDEDVEVIEEIEDLDSVRIDDSESKPSILLELNELYNIALSENEIKRGEDNWYIYCSKVISILNKQNKINLDILKKFVISHMLEMLNYKNQIELINYLYFEDSLSDFEKMLKFYYDNQIIKEKNVKGLVLDKKGTKQLIVLNKDNWEEGQSEDYEDLKLKLKNLDIANENLNQYVGFISFFNDLVNVFKVKNLQDTRSKGARCDQAGKINTLNLLNKIIGENKYTIENTKGRNQIEFCVFQEFLLRYFDLVRKDEKRWFLSISEALYSNIEKRYFN